MTPGRIEGIIARVNSAQSIETKDIDRGESGKHKTVASYDFVIVSADNNGACWMYEDDYEFILYAPDDIRDLVEALEEARSKIKELKRDVEHWKKTNTESIRLRNVVCEKFAIYRTRIDIMFGIKKIPKE